MEHPTIFPHLVPDGATVVAVWADFLADSGESFVGQKIGRQCWRRQTGRRTNRRSTFRENFGSPTADGVGLGPPALG